MNGHKCEGFSFDATWYQEPFIATLDLIAEKGLMVEINTKNLEKEATAISPERVSRITERDEHPRDG